MLPLIINFLNPLKAFFSIEDIDDGKIISSKDVHPSNANDPIEFKSLVLNIIFFNDVQFLNDSSGMFWILPFIVNSSIPAKALLSIFWIDDGIDIVNDLIPSNADGPIVVIVFVFNDICVKDTLSLNESFGILIIFPPITKFVKPLKALLFIDNIDEGNETSVSEVHPSNARDPINFNELQSNDIFVKDMQFLNDSSGICSISPLIVKNFISLKASFSIFWIDDGKEISVNDEHPSNADDPIVVNAFVWNIIWVNDEQFLNDSLGTCRISPVIVKVLIFLNASVSIIWIEDGKEISCNDVHPSKADDPIDVNEFELSTNFVNEVLFLNESFGILWISPFIANSLIPWKALLSIVWIDDGKVISVNDEQYSNADLPIDFNFLVLNMIWFNDEQFLNASFGTCSMSLFIVKDITPWKA